VVRVIDGDTIEVERFGKVRLLGVDAPESVDPRREVQPFGREAALYTRARLLGRRVRLEFDPVRRRDRYGRILAYVFLPDGTLFNELLLRDGYAHVYTGHPFERMEQFLEAQREAREAGRGLWRPPSGRSDAATRRAVTPQPLADPACDPSYPEVCIPSPPPDLDCPDVAARRFAVVGGDPHRFDGDGDGLGCER
jgi:micrococcal nuclease